MTRAFGDLSLPAELREEREASGDPLLDALLRIFEAVISYDGADLWATIAGSQNPIVRRTFAHNPSTEAFREATTPALYLWRDTIGKARWICAGWRVRPSRLMLRWVPPTVPNSQERLRKWDPFFNLIPSSLETAIELSRHPGFVADGDLDPLAATRGSLFWDHVSVFKLEVARDEIRRQTFQVAREAAAPLLFEALDIPIELEERFEPDRRERDEVDHIDVSIGPNPTDPTAPVNDGRLNADPD
jgi:hypothetical protein